MSAFIQTLAEWTPFAGGLAGFAAFSEMLWRKLVVQPRYRKAGQAVADVVRGIRQDLKRSELVTASSVDLLSSGGRRD